MTHNHKARRRKETEHQAPEYPMVHHTHADLLFKLNIERLWKSMTALRMDVNMRRVFNTPEYRVAVTNELLDELNKYAERQRAMADEAGIELHWEPPTIIWDHVADRYVAVRYDRNAQSWPLVPETEQDTHAIQMDGELQ